MEMLTRKQVEQMLRGVPVVEEKAYCSRCGEKDNIEELTENMECLPQFMFEFGGKKYKCLKCVELDRQATMNISYAKMMVRPESCIGCKYFDKWTYSRIHPKSNPFPIYGPGDNYYGLNAPPQPKYPYCTLYNKQLEEGSEPLTRFCFTWDGA